MAQRVALMRRKQSEQEFRNLMKRCGIWWHKYRDVIFCRFCGQQQWKDSELPDFMIVWQGRAYLVECKQANAAWHFTDAKGSGIREIQRRELDRWEAEHNPCFLFLTLGAGRVPAARSAWLIPWKDWKDLEASLAQQKLDLEDQFKGYFDDLSAAQIEAFLVPLIQQHNGKITYFQTTSKAVIIPAVTLRTREALSYRIKTLVDEYNGILPVEGEVPTTDSELIKTQISYVIDLSFDDYLALTDTIDTLGLSVLVVSSSYAIEDGLANFLFDLYSLSKIQEPTP